MIEILAQVIEPASATGPGFAAGIVLRSDWVVEAAPKLRFMKGWSRERVRNYCRAREWNVSVVEERHIPDAQRNMRMKNNNKNAASSPQPNARSNRDGGG
jgi:hypothetical protein